jgi:hypothetical protein
VPSIGGPGTAGFEQAALYGQQERECPFGGRCPGWPGAAVFIEAGLNQPADCPSRWPAARGLRDAGLSGGRYKPPPLNGTREQWLVCRTPLEEPVAKNANVFVVTGEIKKVDISEPKDPKRGASAIILLQYGPPRKQTGNAVEFVNAVLIRIPNYKFPVLRERIRVGQHVAVVGKLQGVYKPMMDTGFYTTELVADRVDFDDHAEEAPKAE